MRTNEKQGQAVRNKYLLAVLLVLALAPLIFYFAGQSRPERVREEPWIGYSASLLWDEAEGNDYWLTDSPKGSVIHVRSTAGGPQRVLVSEDPGLVIACSTRTDDGIVYGAIKRPPPRAAETVALRSPGLPPVIQYDGTFRGAPTLLSVSASSRESRRALPRPQRYNTPTMILKRVSQHGGGPVELARIEGRNPILVGDDVYWLLPRPDDMVYISTNVRRRVEVTGHSDLMITHLKNGRTQRLHGGLPAQVQLFSGSQGVFWTEPRPYPDRSIDLYYLRGANPRPTILATFTGICPYTAPEGVLEYRGRVYWTVRDDGADTLGGYSSSTVQVDVCSMRLDGSDRRTVLSRAIPRNGLAMAPRRYRDALYLVLSSETGETNFTRRAGGGRCLYRINTQARDTLDTVKALPRRAYGFRFAGDHVYYAVREARKSFWQSITGDDVSAEFVEAVYRAPLRQ